MKSLRGQTAILTGATGGIGCHIARALAQAGTNLVLTAYPGVGLEELCSEAAQSGVKVLPLAFDLGEAEQRQALVSTALKEFGRVDVLVNNAGIEFTAAYHELSVQDIRDVLRVNLEAPMLLTHAVLPEMLRRRWGHIVNISSFAGRLCPGYQEPYAATKAALTAFTHSLRGTYRRTGVSASTICPGFVDAGIYLRAKAKYGGAAPGLFGASVCTPQQVARSVIRAIEGDVGEIFVNRYPVRPILALYGLSPALGAWITDRVLGAHDFFQAVAQARKAAP
jgi:short-subunit dehydrogenase